MTLPIDHVPPDELYPLVLLVRDRLRAHAEYLGCEAAAIVDYPVDPADDRIPAAIEIYGRTEEEDFGDHGATQSTRSEAVILVVVRVAALKDWQQALLDLRARVRAVLLQDPEFTGKVRFRRLDTEPLFDGEGRLTLATATMRFTTLPYVTDYPPAGLPDLAGVDIDTHFGGESRLKTSINLEDET